MPEISVIVPVYKAEKYLHRCVDSVLAQTFTDFELILVDDGSPDNSGIICDEYASKDTRVSVIHKENGGVSSARNAGLDVAQGNWIAFVDSDDYVGPEYLKNLYEPEFDITIAGYISTDLANQTDNVVIYHPFCCKGMAGEHIQRLLNENGKDWLYFCWGRLYNKKIIELNALRFNTQYQSGEDTIFMATYVTCCNSLTIKPVADYFYVLQKNGTLSTTFDIDYLKGITETETIVAQVMQARFGIRYPCKTEHELCFAYAGYMGDVASSSCFTFSQKYAIFRYLFKNPYFIKAIQKRNVYFSGTSKAYRALLLLRSPLLMLAALRGVACTKKSQK